MIALDPNDTWEYVPLCDRNLPDDEQTTFTLKVLSAKDQARIEDHLGSVDDTGGYKLTLGSQALFVLNIGLKDVSNLKDKDGKEVKLERDNKVRHGLYELKDSFLNRIPKAVRTELANAIQRGGELTEDEVKN